MPIFWTDDTPEAERGFVWILRVREFDAILGVYGSEQAVETELERLRREAPVAAKLTWVDKRKVG